MLAGAPGSAVQAGEDGYRGLMWNQGGAKGRGPVWESLNVKKRGCRARHEGPREVLSNDHVGTDLAVLHLNGRR